MVFQKIIIFNLNTLYQILKELENTLEFKIIEINDDKVLKNEILNTNKYLVISKKKIPGVNKQIVLNFLPTKINELIEKININLLKIKFNYQSKQKINDYIIDLNSKELVKNHKKIKLTEKEVNIIMYLFKKKLPTSISELEKNVWKYQFDIETHTVETHIYRLRKKITKVFNDDYFILSAKNGYEIKS